MLAPVIGMLLGFLLMVAVTWIFRRWHPFRVDQLFRRLQLVSAGLYSLGHGGNDAQKTMGIITGLLVASGYLQRVRGAALGDPDQPRRDRPRHHVRRLADREDHGHQDHQAPAIGGFCAETAGAITLVGATLGGIPVSTTHTITGAIMGVGATRGFPP